MSFFLRQKINGGLRDIVGELSAVVRLGRAHLLPIVRRGGGAGGAARSPGFRGGA